jgi:hypothetical protein
MVLIAKDTPKTYPSYTNRALDQGVLDQLMVTLEHYVGEQFNAGRIDKAKYGEVYLSMMDTATANATQFILGLLLVDEKRRAADLENQKSEWEYENMLPKQLEMIDKQIEKITAEISLLGKQEDKIDKEIEFLTYKILTERANTEAGVADPLSLIGKQITLLTAQRIGFAGNIQNKVAKTYADFDAVLLSVHENPLQVELSEDTVTELADAKVLADSIEGLT